MSKGYSKFPKLLYINVEDFRDKYIYDVEHFFTLFTSIIAVFVGIIVGFTEKYAEILSTYLGFFCKFIAVLEL